MFGTQGQMAKRCFYDVLGVSRSCSEGELKSAFRKAAMDCHPDRNPGNHDAEVKFKELNEAYQTLSDAQKRASYDRYGHAAFEHGSGFGAGDGFAASMSDIFDDLFGDVMNRRGGRRRSRARLGSALQYGDHARRGLLRQGRFAHPAGLRHLRAMRRAPARGLARSRGTARPAAARGASARSRASSRSSEPARIATGAATSSTIPARPAAAAGM